MGKEKQIETEYSSWLVKNVHCICNYLLWRQNNVLIGEFTCRSLVKLYDNLGHEINFFFSSLLALSQFQKVGCHFFMVVKCDNK